MLLLFVCADERHPGHLCKRTGPAV